MFLSPSGARYQEQGVRKYSDEVTCADVLPCRDANRHVCPAVTESSKSQMYQLLSALLLTMDGLAQRGSGVVTHYQALHRTADATSSTVNTAARSTTRFIQLVMLRAMLGRAAEVAGTKHGSLPRVAR